MISKMLKMQMLEDEDDLAYAETEKKTRTDSTSDGRPAWMRTLHTTASNWLHLIPQTLSHLKRTVENIKVAGGWRAGQVPRSQVLDMVTDNRSVDRWFHCAGRNVLTHMSPQGRCPAEPRHWAK